MKKLMIAAALMAATVSANAQAEVGTFTLQPKVGLTLTTITSAENKQMYPGLMAGVEGEYQITPLISVAAGLVYEQQGTSFSDNTTNVFGSVYGLKDAKTELAYINVPIVANFYVAKNFALKVGIQPGFLTSAKHKGTNIAANVETKYDVDAKDYCNTFDFSIPVGLSYQFSDFVLDARYNWGLTKINKDDTASKVQWPKDSYKNSVFQLTIGYKFAL